MDTEVDLLSSRRVVLIFAATDDMMLRIDHLAALRTVADGRVTPAVIQIWADRVGSHEPSSTGFGEGWWSG